MKVVATPLLVGISCLISRFTAPFCHQASPRIVRYLSASKNNDSPSFDWDYVKSLQQENVELRCQIDDLQCQLKELKSTKLDLERTFAMVFEAFRLYRHTVAELDLDSGGLQHHKVDAHYSRIQQGLEHGNVKSIYRVLQMESDADFQMLKEFRNRHAHHSTLDLNHLREWREQLKRQQLNELNQQEQMLISASLKVLHEIIGFLTTKDNAKMIQNLKTREAASEEYSTKMAIKSCKFNELHTSKSQLKKLIKATKNKKLARKSCCDDIKACFNDLVYGKSSLRRKTFNVQQDRFKPSNPMQDPDFDAGSVIKSGKFTPKDQEDSS